MTQYKGPPVGAQYSLDTPVTANSGAATGGFFDTFNQSIQALGNLSGVALNTYANVRAIKGGQPETTYDRQLVYDISGTPVRSTVNASPTLIYGGVLLIALAAFLLIRR